LQCSGLNGLLVVAAFRDDSTVEIATSRGATVGAFSSDGGYAKKRGWGLEHLARAFYYWQVGLKVRELSRRESPQ
jgi:hypothetical protein